LKKPTKLDITKKLINAQFVNATGVTGANPVPPIPSVAMSVSQV
jgi:hypothetical protein